MQLEGRFLVVIDETRPLVVRLALPFDAGKHDAALLHAGRAYCYCPTDVMVLSLADLEAAFDRGSSALVVDIDERFPVRRPQAKARAIVQFRIENRFSVKDLDRDRWMCIPWVPGLRRDLEITLYDEVMRDHFREVELFGELRHVIFDPPQSTRATCELVVEPAVDPTGTLVRSSTTVRHDALDRVFGQLADDPADEAARMGHRRSARRSRRAVRGSVRVAAVGSEGRRRAARCARHARELPPRDRVARKPAARRDAVRERAARR